MAVGRLKVWNHVTGAWEYVAPGLMGATGPTGGQGATGPQGTQGATGAQGTQGFTGPIGPNGATGAQGPSGVPGTGNVTTTGAQTLTNKRIEKRVNTTTTRTDFNPDLAYDLYEVTAQSGALNFGMPSYTPVNGDTHLFRIKDNGTARAITFNASYYTALGVTLPTTTVAGKWLAILTVYNTNTSRFQVLAVGQET